MVEFRKAIKQKYTDEGKVLDSIVYNDTIEYCPNGHQNNLKLKGRSSNVCPVSSCEYSEVST